MRRLAAAPLALALLVALIASPAGAAPSDEPRQALGAEGVVYRVVAGPAGALFSGILGQSPSTPVLALDVIRGDRVDRWLVPDTGGDDDETAAAVVYERASDTLYVVWATNFNLVHSRLQVTGFHDGEWSESIEIRSDPFALKMSPRLAVTRDRFVQHALDGTASTHERTILHAIWWEEGGLGQRVLYAPLIFVDGELAETVDPLELSILDDAVSGGAAELPLSLVSSPALGQAESADRLLATFADSRTGRLDVVELEPIPLELSTLADNARAHIVEVGAQACTSPDTLSAGLAVADSARAHIVEVGRSDFHRSLLGHVAAVVADQLAADAASVCGDTEAAAGQAAETVLESASEALHDGLLKKASSARAHIVEVGRSPSLGVPHKVRMQLVAQREAPAVGAGVVHVFTSRSGRETLVAWESDGRVAYVESRADGWSIPTVLRLDDELTLGEALAVLENRVIDR